MSIIAKPLSSAVATAPQGLPRRQFLGTALAGGLLSAGLGAHAAEPAYPQRPVTLVVPYAPGGQGDVFARLIGERLGKLWGQSVIVDNKPGATGALGARLVAKAKPDGYTLLLGQTGELAVNASVVRQLGYDPVKDFRPVVLVGESPLVLVVPASAPYDQLAGLLQAAKAAPEGLSYASSGTATPGHIAGAALAQASGAKLVHVPYKGAGQAMSDLLGAQVQMFFASAASVIGHVQSGKLKALAVCGSRRILALPNVPSMTEAGWPRLSFGLWGGVLAPAGTPDAIVNSLNQQINTILDEPTLRKRFESEGSAVDRNTPAEFAELIQRDVARYAQLVKAMGIQAE